MLIIIILSSCVVFAQDNIDKDDEFVDVYMFYGQGCPHCAKAEKFFDEIKDDYPQMRLHSYEVYFNDSNRKLFSDFCEKAGSSIQGVPTIFIDDYMVAGFNNDIAEKIKENLDSCVTNTCESSEFKNPKPKDIDVDNPSLEVGHSLIGCLFLVFVGLLILIYVTKNIIRHKKKLKNCKFICAILGKPKKKKVTKKINKTIKKKTKLVKKKVKKTKNKKRV